MSVICYRLCKCLSVRDDREASERQEERLATLMPFNREDFMFSRDLKKARQLCALNERQSSSRVEAACSTTRGEASTYGAPSKSSVSTPRSLLAKHDVEPTKFVWAVESAAGH
jgi:hypothetical protein